jgi:hypothetical protein
MSENENSGGGILRWIVLGVVFSVLAVTLSEGLRDRVLDALFGAEEEFDYSPSSNGEGPMTNGSAPVADAQTAS